MSQLTTAAPDAGELNAFGTHLARVFAGQEQQPPFAAHLDLGGVSVERGRVVFALDVQPFHLNPLGTLHGGVMATLLDSAMGCAVHTTLEDDVLYSSGDLAVRFLRPVQAGERVEAAGWVVHRGRRTATAEGEILGPGGRLVAKASSTCVILR